MPSQDDYTQAVYEHILSLGDVGDEVKTDIHPHLMKKYDLTAEEARAARDEAMKDLTARGIVERLNPPGGPLRILKRDPWSPGGKFVDDGLRPID